MNTLHEYYMRMALMEANEALEQREFPVGCVLVADGVILATGGRKNSRGMCNEIDHAEIVALRKCRNDNPSVDFSTVTAYSTMEPCLMCTATLIVNGIQSVVFGFEDVMGGGTNIPLPQLSPLYASHPFKVTGGVLRRECLELFYRFFANPQTRYLRNTLLARHSLEEGEKENFQLP